jgi:hypothetical protein
MSEVFVLGIRHHGPGSARAVAAALDELRPDAVVVEGPPELDAVAPLVASAGMRPPVAALVYALDRPRAAAFYPMAVFSPEWVALRWASAHGRPARFADLPAAVTLAARDEPPAPRVKGVRRDPLAALAAAAGYDDAERWWEDAIEHRYHGIGVFDAVLHAMQALRDAEPGGGDDGDGDGDDTFVREAAMRRTIRAVRAQGHERVAVVCGAWHAPALVPADFPTAAADARTLKGLPTTKVAATWVPWTSARLGRASGYGAGVTSPGWYHHLFTAPDHVVLRWLVKTAALLRVERIDVSSASVIEAVRLADTLAVLRARPLPGLAELTEATEAVLCGGSSVPLDVVARKLLVGDVLGRVPPETPMVPLARDLAATQRRLRLKPGAAASTVELDLRTESHLERSRLFHRLLLIDVPWATPAATGRTRGTFKEAWDLQWHPELDVALIEASGSGTTIESAATSVVARRAADDADVAQLARLVESALLADLPDGLSAVLAALGERAARQHDTTVLMSAVEPLARVRRYGDVRRSDTGVVAGVLAGIVTRVAVGLPSACASLDDDAAAAVQDRMESVQRGIAMLDDEPLRNEWLGALATVARQGGVHGLVAGRATRLLLDAERVDMDTAARRLSLALSPGADAVRGAAWLEGFLTGDAVLLLHEPELLGVVDGWLTGAGAEVFDDLLPLLRRTFAGWAPAERRAVGDHVRRLDAGEPARRGVGAGAEGEVDAERAARVVPRLLEILGKQR